MKDLPIKPRLSPPGLPRRGPGDSPLWVSCALFLLILISTFPVWAQEASSPSVSSTSEGGAGEKAAEAAAIWTAHQEFVRQGDWGKSQQELEKLYQWKLDQGIRNHLPYASALIRESLQMNGETDPLLLLGFLDYAEKMAPDFAQVAYARARWFWSADSLSWTHAVHSVSYAWRGLSLSFQYPEEALLRYSHLSLWVLGSFFITFMVFALSLVFRYHSFLAHQLQHLIPVKMNRLAMVILVVFLLLIPFIFGLGWMWLFGIWLLVFWAYGNRADRKVTVFLVALLLVLPTGIRFYSSVWVAMAGNGIPEITRANMGAWDPGLQKRLADILQANPTDPDILQALGLVEKRMGQYAEAEQRLRQWTQLDPGASAAFNNLGNVYLATNRLDPAVEAYQKAIELAPARAESYFNLGQAYLLKLKMKEAEAEFQQAREMQPKLISYYTNISSKNPNRLTIDQTIETSRLCRRIWMSTPDQEVIAQGVWNVLWNRLPLQYGEAAGAALLVFLGFIHAACRWKVSIRRCERCGRLICFRCTRSMVIGNQCSQCINVFSPGSVADPKVVKQKKAEVARYQARQRSLPQRLSWILPGVGHLLCKRSGEGVLYLFLFFLFLTKIFLWKVGIPSPLAIDISPDLPWMVGMAVLFLVFYSFVQYRMMRFRPVKGGRAHFRKG